MVVDDASTDDSVEVLRNWQQSHPAVALKLVCHEVNRGLTPSLNEACRLANGDVLVPMAADDELLKDGIRLRVNYLEDHPEKLAVFADCHVIDEAGSLIHTSGIEGLHRRTGARKRDLACPGLLPYVLTFSWGIPGPVIALRSGFAEVVGAYDEALCVEDWDLYLRLAATGRLGFIDGFVSRYRRHSGNLSQTARTAIAADLARTAAKNAGLYRGLPQARLKVLSWGAPRPGSRLALCRALASRGGIPFLRTIYRLHLPRLRRRFSSPLEERR